MYTCIFRLVYNYCTTRDYLTPINTLTKGVNGKSNQSNAQIVGEELYSNLKKFLTDYLENICQVEFCYIMFVFFQVIMDFRRHT